MNPTPHHAWLGLAKLPMIVVLPDVIVKAALNLIDHGGLRYPDNEKLPVSENNPGWGPAAVPLTLKPSTRFRWSDWDNLRTQSRRSTYPPR